MEKAQIAVLRSEVDSQLEEIDKIYCRIDERKGLRSQVEVEGLSLWLHHLYCAFEGLFKIIARAFENNIIEEERYHIELLRRMKLRIDGVRPALLSEDGFKLLDNLRAFRHRLRHAYVYDMDVDKVRGVLADALALRDVCRKDVERFFGELG